MTIKSMKALHTSKEVREKARQISRSLSDRKERHRTHPFIIAQPERLGESLEEEISLVLESGDENKGQETCHSEQQTVSKK
jgi:hypothetical protein